MYHCLIRYKISHNRVRDSSMGSGTPVGLENQQHYFQVQNSEKYIFTVFGTSNSHL
jgi:hypothetical protein